MINNNEIFSRIAHALLIDYSSVYYVDAVTNEYQWYSIDPEFCSLQIEQGGKDFFRNMARDAKKVVYEEDQHIFLSDIRREKLLSEMKKGTMQSVTYRLMIDGKPVYHMLRLIRGIGESEDYFILGVINVDKEVRVREEAEKNEKERDTFNQIAQSLAEHYDTIYYVNAETERYVEFSSTNLMQAISSPNRGENFFSQAKKNIDAVIHPDDRMMLHAFFNKTLLLGSMQFPEVRQIEYRLLVEGGDIFVRLSAMYTRDKRHLLFCVENIDEQVRALHLATEMAHTDELTGTKNKNAFQEREAALQDMLNVSAWTAFAIVVCDVNNLKAINDTQGHKAGDECIKAAAKLVCDVFKHSPVYRIGGDEFVVVLTESDYKHREKLLAALNAQAQDNLRADVPPVVAAGMADYDASIDRTVADVFDRADQRMYECKRRLKEGLLA